MWCPIPGYEELYAVSEDGEVFSYHRRRVLKGSIDKDGYRAYGLCGVGKMRIFHGHVLVMLAFVGPRPEGMKMVCHWDGNPINNRLDNLRYGTGLDNYLDSVRHGTAYRMPGRNPKPKKMQLSLRLYVRKQQSNKGWKPVNISALMADNGQENG